MGIWAVTSVKASGRGLPAISVLVAFSLENRKACRDMPMHGLTSFIYENINHCVDLA